MRPKLRSGNQPEANRRNARKNSGRVFSYYSSSDSQASFRTGSRLKLTSLSLPRMSYKNWLRQAPFLLSAGAIILSIAYILSTDMKPKIIVSKDSPSALVRQEADYQAAIEKYLKSSIFNRCKLLVDSTGIKNRLLTDFPEIADANIAVPLIGRRPVVSLAAARPSLSVDAGHGAFIVDSRGKAIIKLAEAPGLEKNQLPMVIDQSGVEIAVGGSVLPSGSVAFIETVAGQITAAAINASGYVLPKIPGELNVNITGLPYFVKFNLNEDAREQAGTYLAVKARLESEHKTPAEYIDVRVPGRAYYK